MPGDQTYRPIVRLSPEHAHHPLPFDVACPCGWWRVAASIGEGCDRARAHLADHMSWAVEVAS